MDYKAKYKISFTKSNLIDIDNKNMINIYHYGYFVCTRSQRECKLIYNLSDTQIKKIIGD